MACTVLPYSKISCWLKNEDKKYPLCHSRKPEENQRNFIRHPLKQQNLGDAESNNNNNAEHKFPRPGPLWRIPCQQDLQFVAAELVQVEDTLIFSVLALEVLNWLSHVNPNSIISLPRINSASSSFGGYTVGECVTEAHRCTHTHRHMLWEQVPRCTVKSRPFLELLSRPWCPDEKEGLYPLQAFSYLLYASQNPRW